MDQLGLDTPTGRSELTRSTPVLRPVRFEPPRLHTVGTRRIDRSTDEQIALAKAREEGRQEALAEMQALLDAHRRAEHDLELAAQALASALDHLEHGDLVTLGHLERQALSLAVGIAEELVGRELRAFDDVAAQSAAKALSMTPERAATVLRVNPADLAGVIESAALMGHRAGDVQVVADASVERGGCIAVAGPLQVDAQIGAALARIRDALSR